MSIVVLHVFTFLVEGCCQVRCIFRSANRNEKEKQEENNETNGNNVYETNELARLTRIILFSELPFDETNNDTSSNNNNNNNEEEDEEEINLDGKSTFEKHQIRVKLIENEQIVDDSIVFLVEKTNQIY
jgi:hypothetical protein